MHRALEEIRKFRVVQRAYRRGGPQGIAQRANRRHQAACLQGAQQWGVEQALCFPGMAGVEVVAAGELLQARAYIAPLHAQQARVDVEPEQLEGRTGFWRTGQHPIQIHAFAALRRRVQCMPPEHRLFGVDHCLAGGGGGVCLA